MKLHKEGWEETETCRKNTTTKAHQGQKKNSIMLYQQKTPYFSNQEISEQIKGDIKPWADVSKIAGVFNGCFTSVSLRRLAAIRWQMQKVVEQINYLLALRS